MINKIKTKIILHGGFDPEKADEGAPNFHIELLNSTPNGGVVLIVPFAKENDRVLIGVERTINDFNRLTQRKDIRYVIANEFDFENQVSEADTIYFLGGSSSKLLRVLNNYNNISDRLYGKVIAGDSAGANVLTSFFYSKSTNTTEKGLGLLPIKFIAHYKEENLYKFDSENNGMEEVFLKEYEFKIFKI